MTGNCLPDYRFVSRQISNQGHHAAFGPAEEFSAVFPRFLNWIGPEPYRICSWSTFNLNRFKTDYAPHRNSVSAAIFEVNVYVGRA